MISQLTGGHKNYEGQSKNRYLPNNPKIISIKMPRLHGVFLVLENDFDEVVEGDSYDRCGYKCRALGGNGLNRIHTKDTRDVKIISKLQRGIRINVGDPVNSVSLFPIDERCRVGKHKCLCRCDISIME